MESGDLGNTWYTAFIPVTSTTPYQLVFESTVGGDAGDIALDDVNYKAGQCPLPGKILLSCGWGVLIIFPINMTQTYWAF